MSLILDSEHSLLCAVARVGSQVSFSQNQIHAVYSRTATWFQGLVLVYYYTGICDVTVTIKIYLVTQNWTSLRRSRVADKEKTAWF